MNEIKITSPDKILFPDDDIKKIDLIDYYIAISEQMLPYLQNRLLCEIRCHDGIYGQTFFKKHPTTDKKYVNTTLVNGEEYFYIKESFQLVYQVQNGAIEFHTSGAKVRKKPDIMIFDFDPDENLSLDTLRLAVKKVKSVLDHLNLTSFLKTSGGKGYHVVIPFNQTKSWESFYEFSKKIAILVEKEFSDLFTTNIKKDKRKGKIFIDYLRNNKGSTCVAPYSVRARKGAPISMPISWKDLDNLSPNQITVKNYKKYLNKSWDYFFMIEQKLN